MEEQSESSDPAVMVYATESGDVVLKLTGGDGGPSIRIPHEKIHQVTVWMRRIAAEFDGLEIPPGPVSEPAPRRHKVI